MRKSLVQSLRRSRGPLSKAPIMTIIGDRRKQRYDETLLNGECSIWIKPCHISLAVRARFAIEPRHARARYPLARPRRFERPTIAAGASPLIQLSKIRAVAAGGGFVYSCAQAPVAQLDRALPSEGKGRTFESSRARHRQLSHDNPTVFENRHRRMERTAALRRRGPGHR